jgi:chromosomal replication initiation ATPase DnaA
MIYNAYAIPGLKNMQNYLLKDTSSINIDRIIEVTLKYYGLSLEQIQQRIRDNQIINCRRMIIYLLRENTSLTQTEIAKKFNKACLDHTTIVHHMKVARGFIKVNDEIFMQDLKNLKLLI